MENGTTVVAVSTQSESRELSTYTARDIKNQVNLIQEVMQAVMQEGQHYGKIPGTDKPTLLKAGAEKLTMTFRLAPSFHVEISDLGGGHREYQVRCTLTHILTGRVYGEGLGSCSTMESKYRYRSGKRKCPSCQAEGSLVQTKGGRNPGGYWCVPDKGGCNANFNKGDESIEKQQVGKVENLDIADVFNTVLKMAKKRALVDATLTATAASDCFTQDIEDFEDVHSVPLQAHTQKPAIEPTPEGISQPQRRKLFALLHEHGLSEDGLKAYMQGEMNKESTKQLSQEEFNHLLVNIEDGTIKAWLTVPDQEGIEEHD